MNQGYGQSRPANPAYDSGDAWKRYVRSGREAVAGNEQPVFGDAPSQRLTKIGSKSQITIGQAATILREGTVKVVTDGSSMHPDRYTFADVGDLYDYLRQVLGGRPAGEGIRGLMSLKGTYSRSFGSIARPPSPFRRLTTA